MIFAESTIINLNYLQNKEICIFQKIMGYRSKVSFFPNNLKFIIFIYLLFSDFAKFEDLYFKPLLEEFRNFKNFSKSIMKEKKFLLVTSDKITNKFWQQQLSHIIAKECPLPCSFTGDLEKASEVDAIVFYLRHLKNRKSLGKFVQKRNPKQPWVMLTFEAPLLANSVHRTNYNEFNGIFNRTMMHRTDADVFTPHGFIISNEDAHLVPSSWVSVPRSFKKQNSTLLAVTFISNCNAASGRLQYIRQMQNFSKKVHVYGKCGQKKCGSTHYVQHAYNTTTDHCFVEAGQKYLFYLAFENSICKDYVTEKLYNLLYHSIVPVVMGGVNYDSILPPHSYINAAHYSPEKLVRYLEFLSENPSEYRKYFVWKEFHRTSTIGGVRSMCYLCVRLYDPEFYEYKVYSDFYYWFSTMGNCRRKWENEKGISSF